MPAPTVSFQDKWTNVLPETPTDPGIPQVVQDLLLGGGTFTRMFK